TERSAQLVQDLNRYVAQAGRNPTDFGIEAGSATTKENPEHAVETAKSWEKLGATHHTLNTMNAGYSNPDEHIGAIAEFKKAMG
ncbi:LLM class F420-dependent oxidoreductase, partial [Dehalococcoidia bacterium]|nr:LLM class F420-dependent oxidoreductase [Dehalococcoidia bacterium]